MESSIYGVPPSGAQMGRSDSSVSGIRAPITADESDFERSGSSYYSGSELEGYESGEDVSEKARVVEEDEVIVEERDTVKELAISDGAVVELKGEGVQGTSRSERDFVQESGNVGGIGVSRPLARYPSIRSYKGVGNDIDGSDDSGSLSNSSDDEIVEELKYGASLRSARPVVAVVNKEVSEGEFTPVMGTRVLSARKLSIPVAKISVDSDDDSANSEVLDDEVFSGVARVPSIEILNRTNSAPKVRMLEGDEGDENGSKAEDILEMELVGDLQASGMDLSPLDVKESIVVENLLLQESGHDYKEETMADSLALNPTSELRHNGGLIHLYEDIKEVDVFEDRKECVELVDFTEPIDFAESIVLQNSVAEAEVSEPGDSLDGVDCKNNNAALQEHCIFNQDSESENVESMKQAIGQMVESFSSITDLEVTSAHQCFDISEVPAVLTQTTSVDICDSISEDASSTCAFAADQSAFEGLKPEQETGGEAETGDILPDEVEKSDTDVVQDSTTPHTGGVLLDHLQEIDGEVNVDGEMSNSIIDAAASAALFKTVRSVASDDDDIESVSLDGAESSPLGRNLEDLGIFDAAKATTHGVNPSSTNSDFIEALSESEKENIKNIQKIHVKYLHLLDRLGRSHEDSVAPDVLHQLALAAGTGTSSSVEFHLDAIKNAASELEAQRKDNPDFSLTVLIIGKTGVGKSATVNSIFGAGTAVVDAFEPATTRVKEITGSINGVKLKIFDTPGLRTSLADQSTNWKILSSIKKVMKKSAPDVIMYIDRLDTQRGNLNDLPLLRLVTSCLGSSIWRKSIVAFTHGSAVPPDGPNGHPLSYEAFVAQQLQVIQQLISHSAGEPVTMNSGSILPVCVVENHSFAEKNLCGEISLHNGDRWRSQLLLLCCSMKILSEAFNSSDSYQEEDTVKQSRGGTRRFKSLSISEVVEQETEASESLALQLTKDKEEFDIKLHSSVSAKSGVKGLVMAGLNILHVEEKLAYTLKGETRIKKLGKHRTAAAASITFDGENMVSGLKFEDRVAIGERTALVGNAGIVQSQSQEDAAYAYGVNFDICSRGKDIKDHPSNEDETSVGMSVMRCKGGVIYGCNLHSGIPINRMSKLDVTAALNNRRMGRISVKTSSSDQLQIAALALVPIAAAVWKKLFGQYSED